MAQIRLRYGQETIQLKIPERNLAQIIQPRKQQASKDISGVIRQALGNPQNLTLKETVLKRNVGVLIEDGTRAEPHEIIIEELARLLSPAKTLTFIITTGSHEPYSKRNQEIVQAIHASCKKHHLEPYQVIIHDGIKSPCRPIGKTSRGTTVNINENILNLEAFVVAADMKNHYFAGYSNAIKNFLPGICNFATIEANHRLALDPQSTFGHHPLHPNPSRRTNPVAEDMLEAANMITQDRPLFVLATITSGSYILWAGSGNLTDVTAEGFTHIDSATSFTIPATNHIIVSPGGNPQDESLYNAQRGLELTKNAINDNGEILLLAQCPKGTAPTPKAKEFFYDYLTQPIPQIIQQIQHHYKLYSHKSFKFAELIQRLRKIWIHTALKREEVERAHLFYAANPQKVVDGWVENDVEAQIVVFDEANKIAVYAQK